MIRLAIALAALTLALLAQPAAAQLSCRHSLPLPGSALPANVEVLSPSFGGLVLLALGGEVPEDVVAVVAVRGPQTVIILVMTNGIACQGPPVPVEWYERARRTAMGVEG